MPKDNDYFMKNNENIKFFHKNDHNLPDSEYVAS